MKKKIGVALFLMLLLVLAGGYQLLYKRAYRVREYKTTHRKAVIDPAYDGTVIPPNIAPLNFVVNESGKRYYVRIHSTTGKPIEIYSRKPKIVIPLGPWKKMLAANRGLPIHFDIYAADDEGQWVRFESLTNTIANEDIDGFLVYRLIKPLYFFWRNMGIYQRNLESYDESPVFLSRTLANACINCHSFYPNSPDRMVLHMRAGPGTAMFLTREGRVEKINTQTEFNSAVAYSAWHPSGKLLAFSFNEVVQVFHATGENRDVFDLASGLVLYWIDSNTVRTSPEIANPDRMETWPVWSPDGRYLYFCSAPFLESYAPAEIGDEYAYLDKVMYDLMRIGYDYRTGTWGELETVISAAETGLSIAQPRISPDGRFVLFCMSRYGTFPIHRPSSDLYLLDLRTGQHRRLDINSDLSESYHSWSSNSRWIVFSSKRRDGLRARPYFSYVDEEGKAYKPFLLPQKDPAFYDTFMKNYNVPELVSEPVRAKSRDLTRAAFDNSRRLDARLDLGDPPTQLSLGIHYFNANEYDKSQEMLEGFILHEENHAPAYDLLGAILALKGDYAAAESMFNTALGIDPGLFSARYRLGILYMQKEEYDTAEAIFKNVLQYTDDSETHNQLGTIYLVKKDYNKAERELEATLRTNPDNVMALYNLGVMYKDRGQYDRAIPRFKAILQRNPVNLLALDNLNSIYLETGDRNEARNMFSRAYQVAPDNPGICLRFGRVLAMDGERLQEAIYFYNQALSLTPGNVQDYIELGELYLSVGDSARAEQVFETALAINPNAKEVKAKLAPLKEK